MANHKRGKCRYHTRSNLHSMGSWPAWWDILYHTRPRRAAERRLERDIVHGRADADAVAWPVSKKPHNYYW